MKKGKNHSPKSSYAWKEDKTIKKDCCYECGSTEDIQYHHIIPESKGGGMTIPLCIICHGKVHDVDFVKMKKLQKEGIERAKQNGVYSETIEEFLSKPSHSEAVRLIDTWRFDIDQICQMVNLSKSTVKKIYKIMDDNDLRTNKQRYYPYVEEVLETEYSIFFDWDDHKEFEERYKNQHKFWSNDTYIDNVVEYHIWLEDLLHYFYKNLVDIESGLIFVLENTNPKDEHFKCFDDYLSYVLNKTLIEYYYLLKSNHKNYAWRLFWERTIDLENFLGHFPKDDMEEAEKYLLKYLNKKFKEEYLIAKVHIIPHYDDDIRKIYDSGTSGNTIKRIRPDTYKDYNTKKDVDCDELW
jgi:hypothetical protein